MHDVNTGTGQGRPKKSLGQHWLKNPDLAKKIVELAKIDQNDQVMEIGPGPGALTDIIRGKPWNRLVLLEKDDSYAARHKKIARDGQEVVHLDALKFPWATLTGPWKILGNLPYNIASPLMWDLFSTIPELDIAVFMIQKEVADRILAQPGSKTYGGLTVWLRSFVKVQKGFDVAPSNFYPPPKVDSTVLSFKPAPRGERPQNPAALAKLIKLCFQQRRKQMQGILRGVIAHDALPRIISELDILPQTRPEALSVKKFQQLSLFLPMK